MKNKVRLGIAFCCCMLLLRTLAGAQRYQPALPGYQYHFPQDNFSHPAYGTEWWYYTGNLRAPDGHRFGFELTFFRQAISREPSASPWALQDLYMAHLALSDIGGQHFYETERVNRAGPGLAGVDASASVVWNGNWSTTLTAPAHHLQAVGELFSLDLNAAPEKAPVIHGLEGVSQKAEGAGHASHYISYTRMRTTGKIVLHGTTFNVEGDTWMDHEFFSESKGSDEIGWDWLSVQLNDRTELMLYRLRHGDGTVDPYSSGTYVDAAGKAVHLLAADIHMAPSGTVWKSSTTTAAYPIAWTITIPKLGLEMAITTPLGNQEFVSRVGPSYWEGAVDVTGRRGGSSLSGTGYLEMTGYARGSNPVLPTASR